MPETNSPPSESQPAARRSRAVGLMSCVAAALALCLAGCATSPSSNAPTVLTVTGDPGVTVRVQSSAPGVPEQVATVPAELTFHGSSYELRCVHGPQSGRLSLVAHRHGLSISTGDTTRPGEVTVFKVRPNEIAVGPEQPPK